MPHLCYRGRPTYPGSVYSESRSALGWLNVGSTLSTHKRDAGANAQLLPLWYEGALQPVCQVHTRVRQTCTNGPT
jgi:hypothetical protein